MVGVLSHVTMHLKEYLLAALIAKDKKMQESYESGDPYLSFAKLAGAVPQDATKQSHAETRDLYKTITLGFHTLWVVLVWLRD